MEAVDAIKGIHEMGEYNTLISFILVVILGIAVLELLQKVKSLLGIKFKGDLEKETLNNKLIEVETRLKMQEEEIQKYNNDLFEKQKKYHGQSIEIRDGLKQDQDNLSKQISDLSDMMKDYINLQNNCTIASFRSSLWRMHKDFTSQGFITPDGLKTFLEMGKLYEACGGDDIYHSKLLPEVEALDIHYPDGNIYNKNI